ncbi:MAG: hypothetical protein V4644_00370 [Patescibacteria group bacterium]
MSHQVLSSELIKLSKAKSWDQAKLEWEVTNVHRVDEPETCLCDHYPIIEVCTIHNTETGEDARVGNCCVKKFNKDSDKIFRAVARVRKDIEKSLNAETISLALKNTWITGNDYVFYFSIMRKKRLSEKQLAWKKDINLKIGKKVSGS